MKTKYLLHALAAVLIAVSFAVSLWGGPITSYAYEISVALSFAAMSAFVLSAYLSKRKPFFMKAGLHPEKGHLSQKSAIRFSDVAANENARKSLMELTDFLKNPEKYTSLGARIPHGVLLYGPPGTGKTLLARALAGEANVPFIALNGSDFVEMYVGVGASRVRETFRKAKKHGKCVIFIDEIDTLGRTRSNASSEERDQTLNALLGEMSGFHPNEGIIVIAATNRYEMLDPALLRPGRFDRQIEVGMPGVQERMDILRLHAKDKPLSKDVQLSDIAASTAYFSGASLENLLNEAAIRAARRNSDKIEKADIESAYYACIAGEDGSAHRTESEKHIIAVHEAGHALSARALFEKGAIRRISILPSAGGAAGYNLLIPEDKSLYTRADMEKKIVMLLSGRCAEHIFFGEEAVTSGASNDIKRASEIAIGMVNDLGFYAHPAIHEQSFSKYFGISHDSSNQARAILMELYDAALAFLNENRDVLGYLRDELLSKETMGKDEIDRFFASHPLRVSSDSEDSAKQAS